MKGIQKILFPVDLSDVSPKIVPWVLMVAKKFDAEIHVIFVARTLDHFSAMYVEEPYIEDFHAHVIKGAESRMEEFLENYFKEYPKCKGRVLVGDIGEEILHYIQSAGIDLVMIGTHGRKGIERIVFGSVADRVVKSSSVPVLTINPHKVK